MVIVVNSFTKTVLLFLCNVCQICITVSRSIGIQTLQVIEVTRNIVISMKLTKETYPQHAMEFIQRSKFIEASCSENTLKKLNVKRIRNLVSRDQKIDFRYLNKMVSQIFFSYFICYHSFIYSLSIL